MKSDIYEHVTNQIIAQMEKGNRPWIRSWDIDLLLPQRVTGETYRGINIILLWNVALNLGYRQPRRKSHNSNNSKRTKELNNHE